MPETLRAKGCGKSRDRERPGLGRSGVRRGWASAGCGSLLNLVWTPSWQVLATPCCHPDRGVPGGRPELPPVTASYRIHCAFKLKLITRRVDQVLHQRDDRHWTGSARIQSNPACHFLDTIKIDVASKSSRPDSAKSHINHAGSRLHHIGSDQKRPTDL